VLVLPYEGFMPNENGDLESVLASLEPLRVECMQRRAFVRLAEQLQGRPTIVVQKREAKVDVATLNFGAVAGNQQREHVLIPTPINAHGDFARIPIHPNQMSQIARQLQDSVHRASIRNFGHRTDEVQVSQSDMVDKEHLQEGEELAATVTAGAAQDLTLVNSELREAFSQIVGIPSSMLDMNSKHAGNDKFQLIHDETKWCLQKSMSETLTEIFRRARLIALMREASDIRNHTNTALLNRLADAMTQTKVTEVQICSVPPSEVLRQMYQEGFVKDEVIGGLLAASENMPLSTFRSTPSINPQQLLEAGKAKPKPGANFPTNDSPR